MSKKSLPVSIYGYHDYRAFLFDLFRHFEQNRYRFTHRQFAKLAGFSTPNILKSVMEGKRNLTLRTVRKLCTGLDFNKGESAFFEELVLMNQARTHEEKDTHYRRLAKDARYTLLNRDDKNLHEFYSRWYYPVVRELVASTGFRDDPEWIARRIRPAIAPAEAEKALVVLEEAGQIRRVAGRWVQSTPVTTTGPEISSLAVANYHRAMIERAGEALDRFSQKERNISSVTVAISPETYAEFVKEVYSLQQRMLDRSNADPDPRDVYQVNFQIFPVTGRDKEGHS